MPDHLKQNEKKAQKVGTKETKQQQKRNMYPCFNLGQDSYNATMFQIIIQQTIAILFKSHN